MTSTRYRARSRRASASSPSGRDWRGPSSIAGKTIGLLDIAKPRGNIFLDQLEVRLTDAGARVLRFSKPTFTKPAPVDLRHEIATQCELVIEALAD